MPAPIHRSVWLGSSLTLTAQESVLYTHSHSHTCSPLLLGGFIVHKRLHYRARPNKGAREKPSIVERAGQLIRFSVENSTRKFPSKPK